MSFIHIPQKEEGGGRKSVHLLRVKTLRHLRSGKGRETRFPVNRPRKEIDPAFASVRKKSPTYLDLIQPGEKKGETEVLTPSPSPAVTKESKLYCQRRKRRREHTGSGGRFVHQGKKKKRGLVS